jgi:hypothetical protein
MIKYLELVLSQEVYEYLEELDEINWSARGNVLNQYLRNTSIGTTVKHTRQNRFCTEAYRISLFTLLRHIPDYFSYHLQSGVIFAPRCVPN